MGAASVLAVAAAIAGCGPQGPVRHRVHGTVTYAGKPMALGRIVFDPDVTKGNRGPQGFAVIEDGRYDTAVKSGKGTSGGPMLVTIDGYEAGPDGQGTRPVVTGYQEPRDFPTAEGEINFDLPATNRR